MLWRMSGSGTMSSFSVQRPLTLDAICAPTVGSPRGLQVLGRIILGPIGSEHLHWIERRSGHAGAREARTATANSVAITPERTTGSRGLVPKCIDWKMRVAAKLNSTPRPRPNSAGRKLRPSNSINCS